MTETLYDVLVELAEANSGIEKALNEIGEKYSPVVVERIKGNPLSETETKENMRRAFHQYYNSNETLSDAIKGTKTVAQSLDELAEVDRGWRKFLPRRENSAHNTRVEQMEELIGPTNLRTRGLLAPDNFLGGLLFGTLGSYGVCKGYDALSSSPGLYSIPEAIVVATLIGGLLMGLLCQSAGRNLYRPRNEEAEYIDQTIQELKQ